jgi:hypothetical protein
LEPVIPRDRGVDACGDQGLGVHPAASRTFVVNASTARRRPAQWVHRHRDQPRHCLRSIGYAKTPIRGNELHFAGADAITDSNHALAEHVRHSPATG